MLYLYATERKRLSCAGAANKGFPPKALREKPAWGTAWRGRKEQEEAIFVCKDKVGQKERLTLCRD